MSLNKKIIIFFLIIIIIFNSSNGFLKPRQTKAVLSNILFDLGLFLGRNIGIAIAWARDNYEKILRDIVAKRIIDYIVDQTIVWIQGGGKPQFISNWDGFLKDAEAIAIDSVVKEAGLGFLCSPFGLQVKLALLPVQKFSTQISCTLDKIVKNIDEFYIDFSVGDWEGYLASLESQNNYFGVMLIAQDEIMVRSTAKVNASQNEARASGGFLGVKQCLAYEDAGANACTSRLALAPEWQSTSAEDIAAFCTEQYPDKCTKEEIITPGTAVGQAVGSAITSDKEWAANITSWTSALVNALINKYAKEGLSKLKKSEPNAKPDYYPPEYQNLVGSANEKEKESMTKEIQKFSVEWQYLLSAKSKSLSYVQQQNDSLRKLKLIQTATSSQPLPLNCLPLVTDIEIQTTSSTIVALIAETQNLSVKINEANSLINTIKSADFSNIQQRSLTQGAYLQFMDKYNTIEFQTQIISGDARTAADLEVNIKKGELEALQGRLNSCVQTQYEQCLISGQSPTYCLSTYSTSTPPFAP